MLQHNFSFGQQGEERALRYLRDKQYQIWDTNIRVGNHEVDIVAFDTQYQEIVFVEVKTRRTDVFGSPSQSVKYLKLKSLQTLASTYLKTKQVKFNYRFDIVSILPNAVDHLENVTWR